MRIAVTGGSGKLGLTVVRHLQVHGHQVVSLDRSGQRGPGFVQIDLADAGQVLVAEVFPDTPVHGDISGHGTLLSIEKARTVLGYAPQHSWR